MSFFSTDQDNALPASWALASLNDVAELNPRPDLSAFPDGKEVHFVPMAAAAEDFRGLDISARRRLAEVRKGYTAFQSGDVLLAKITPCMENGKGGFVPMLPMHVAFGSTEFHVLRPTDVIEGRWLSHFLSRPSFRREARQNMTGSAGQLRVPSKWLADVKIPVAPKSEQARVIAKLDELLSDLDAGVAELKAAQQKLQRYRQSLLKAAVEGTLTAEWRAKNAPAEPGEELLQRILRERRARWEQQQLAKFAAQGKAPPKGWKDKYPEPQPPKTEGLPELPEGWVWASVEQLAEIQGGIQKQPTRAPVTNKYPFLRVANVARGKLKLDDVHEIELFPGEPERLLLEKGDLLVVEGNGSLTEIGRCALWDGSIERATHQNHLIRVRPLSMDGEFMEAWFNSAGGVGHMTRLAATTSGLYTLSVGKISKIPVPVPPLKEQHAAIELVRVQLEELEQQEAFVTKVLAQSNAQRQNILRAAFRGELVPQDPNDEPASVLLERLRMERTATARAVRRGSRARTRNAQ